MGCGMVALVMARGCLVMARDLKSTSCMLTDIYINLTKTLFSSYRDLVDQMTGESGLLVHWHIHYRIINHRGTLHMYHIRWLMSSGTPQEETFSVSKTLTLSQEHPFVCRKCPRTVNISNVNFTSKISYQMTAESKSMLMVDKKNYQLYDICWKSTTSPEQPCRRNSFKP